MVLLLGSNIWTWHGQTLPRCVWNTLVRLSVCLVRNLASDASSSDGWLEASKLPPAQHSHQTCELILQLVSCGLSASECKDTVYSHKVLSSSDCCATWSDMIEQMQSEAGTGRKTLRCPHVAQRKKAIGVFRQAVDISHLFSLPTQTPVGAGRSPTRGRCRR